MKPTFFAMTFLAFLQPFGRPVASTSEEEVERRSDRVRFDRGRWLVDGAPANAVLVEHAESRAQLSRTPLVDGRRHGVAIRWYEHGQLESVGLYWNGEKAGQHREWWPNGSLRLEASYEMDAYHGEYRAWYPNGRPFELKSYEHGREQGPQRSWTEAGDLFLSYEVRNGRRFGFVNAKPCMTPDAREAS